MFFIGALVLLLNKFFLVQEVCLTFAAIPELFYCGGFYP